MVDISEVVSIVIDYYTIDQPKLAMYAKQALDRAIAAQKHIRLFFKVEKRINLEKFMGMLSASEKYVDSVKEVEIQVGRFQYSDESSNHEIEIAGDANIEAPPHD